MAVHIWFIWSYVYSIQYIYIHTSLQIYTNWWYTYPSEKYESQLGLLCPIYGKIKFMFQTTNQITIIWSYQNTHDNKNIIIVYIYIHTYYHEIRCNYISTYDILERVQKEYYESPSLTFWTTNRYTSVTSPFNNGWLVVYLYLPLWKIWLRQLGWWHSQYMEKYSNQNVPKHQPDFMTFSVYVWNHRPVMAKHILILIIKSHKSHVPEHQPVTIVNGFIMVYKPTITNM